MKPHQLTWLSCLTLMPAIGFGASTQDLSFQVASSLPSDVVQRLSARSLEAFALTAHLNPYYLQGDFDGDGRRDTALLIKHKASGKIGIAVFQSSQPEPIVLGAGIAIGNGGDNFNWMDAWNVKLRGPVRLGAGEASLISLKGDALLVIKTESASGLLYWTGAKYEWYQQAD